MCEACIGSWHSLGSIPMEFFKSEVDAYFQKSVWYSDIAFNKLACKPISNRESKTTFISNCVKLASGAALAFSRKYPTGVAQIGSRGIFPQERVVFGYSIQQTCL